MGDQTLLVDRLVPALGAEISGINLNEVSSNEQYDQIYNALIEHQVIFFRNQSLTPQAHIRLATSFGDLQGQHPVYPHVEGYPNIVILKNDADNPPDADGWHTDYSFQDNPPFTSILVSRQIPDLGGDTLWASLSRAYETLSDAMKSEIAELTAVHDMGDFRNNFTVGESSGDKLTDAHQRFGSAIHPVVKTHPVSGRKFLYVNESFTQHIVGMRATDSNQLLSYLLHHINQPEHQVRFRWTPNTVAMWDNRCTWHYATADYLPASREMNRITVLNDRRAPV